MKMELKTVNSELLQKFRSDKRTNLSWRYTAQAENQWTQDAKGKPQLAVKKKTHFILNIETSFP